MDIAAISPETRDLLRRAVAAVKAASPAEVALNTAVEYRRVAGRILARAGADGTPPALEDMTASRGYYAQLRAAWSRHVHGELVEALAALRRREVPVAAGIRQVRLWLGQLERYPVSRASDANDGPGDRAPSRLSERLTATGALAAASKSKRRLLADLPSAWLFDIWILADEAGHRHLDALAVLVATGCRPVELAAGVLVEREGEGELAFSISGAKVSGDNGQPWRRLHVQAAAQGAAAHLWRLAEDSPVLVQGPSPAAVSAAVAELAGDRWGRRISAYDIRHQRAADARNAFEGDVEACARWLGHAADTTLRYYGRLPRRAGVAGPLPLSAEAARPVRRHRSDRAPLPSHSSGAGPVRGEVQQ